MNNSVPSKTVIYPELKGRTALITGAGKGIGRDCVRELVSQGCNIIAVSRTQSDLDSIYDTHSGENGCHVTVKSLDVNEWDKVEDWFETLPPIDFLINNAGVVRSEKILEMKRESLELVMNTNFTAQFHFAQLAARNMVRNDIKGVIVNMSSIAAFKSLSHSSNYCCSKAALNMLTQCLTGELAQHGIRAVTVSPGFIWTDMLKVNPNVEAFVEFFQKKHPHCKIGDVQDVSRVVSFMLSAGACMISGSNVYLDSGLHA